MFNFIVIVIYLVRSVSICTVRLSQKYITVSNQYSRKNVIYKKTHNTFMRVCITVLHCQSYRLLILNKPLLYLR